MRREMNEERKTKNRRRIYQVITLCQRILEYVFAAWILCIIEVVCEVLVATFSQFAVSAIETADSPDGMDWASLWMWAGIMMGMAIVSATVGILAGFASSTAASGYGKNLRKEMYYKVQDYSFANIDKFSTASLITRMTTDVSNVQFSAQMMLRTVVRAPVMLIFALTMALITEWKLALIFLAIIPFLAVVLFGIVVIVHPTFVKVFNAYDELNASVQENLNGIRVVKSFGREDFEKEKFGKVSYYIYKGFVKAEKLIAWNAPSMNLAVYTAMHLLSWLGANMIVASGNNPMGFTTGKLTSMFSYCMQILSSLMMVSMAFVMLTISHNSAERIQEVMLEVPTIQNPEKPIMEVPNGQVDFNHVSFRYFKDAQKDVLHDIDLHFPSGSTVGIIGVTGSSKTTFTSLLARLYDVTEGSVCVGGHDVREYDIRVLRDAVAVVLQKNVLFSGTIAENLRWGNENTTQEELEFAAKLACADEIIEKKVGKWDFVIEEGGSNLSGGQKQRSALLALCLKTQIF